MNITTDETLNLTHDGEEYDARSADQLRAEAAQHEQDAQDSYERCDTDGFLSQWASGMTAQRKRLQATIVEAGGVATFFRYQVTDLATGEVLPRDRAKICDTQYGQSWRVQLSSGEVVWATANAARESTYSRKGFRVDEVEVVAAATADLRGESATSVHAYIRPADGDQLWQDGWDGCHGVGDLTEEVA